LGEGICPLPDHLKKKILNLEYVDMADLRPEAWLMASSDAEARNNLTSLFGRRKQPVTDVSVWVQCYSSLVSVLVEKYPQYIKHFLAYQSTIVMGAKRSNSLSWVAYDAAYRRKAACTKSLFWGTVDQYLYTVWFANQAHGPACISCFSTDHTTDQCPSNTAIPVLGQAMMQPMLMQPLQQPQPLGVATSQQQQQQQEFCGLFNAKGGSRCPYNPCKYIHACKVCHATHPASQCQQGARKRPFSGQFAGGAGLKRQAGRSQY
jgi:hypothetical protein